MTQDSGFTLFIKNCLAGGTSAAVAKTVTAPLDRVKLLLQTQNAQQTISVDRRYTGFIDCIGRLAKEQGVLSYWRGNSANVARAFPTYALNFALKDTYKRLFIGDIDKQKMFWKFFLGNLTAGGAAGATTLLLVYPLDFARTRLAADVGHNAATREFRGIVHCISRTLHSDGPRGLYRGFLVSVQCVVVYRASYFGSFDTLKAVVARDKRGLSFFTAFAVAQVVAVFSSFCAYPWDTVRRRMMLQSGQKNPLYKHSWDCVRTIFKQEGVRGFYRGQLVNAFRSIGGALVLTVYDEIKKHL